MATGKIFSGVCGFTIEVKAKKRENGKIKMEIKSDCPHYQKINEELKEVDAFKEIFNKLHSGEVYQIFAKHSPHPTCPGISGMLKTIEVEAGLALPKQVIIELYRD
ncbi:DUF6951 family protein [Carboxydothermus ferrireducens]|uniref:Uncharacterized protein n=1 Tax=Carboxydothermus ferrireducens DSM 11255 TaxID=1119529 RepID=A0ABX2RBC1_9THEO|nr:hypothetical protein [Carboxydothermus ferrireducens]NYE58473.1 hypothetical protein [Carboxydothermus ferrireducens DSM 11255]